MKWLTEWRWMKSMNRIRCYRDALSTEEAQVFYKALGVDCIDHLLLYRIDNYKIDGAMEMVQVHRINKAYQDLMKKTQTHELQNSGINNCVGMNNLNSGLY